MDGQQQRLRRVLPPLNRRFCTERLQKPQNLTPPCQSVVLSSSSAPEERWERAGTGSRMVGELIPWDCIVQPGAK